MDIGHWDMATAVKSTDQSVFASNCSMVRLCEETRDFQRSRSCGGYLRRAKYMTREVLPLTAKMVKMVLCEDSR